MFQTKINTFFSTLNIVLVFIGYQLITSLLSLFMLEAEASRLVTVPYRAFALLVCLVTIFLNYKSKFKLNVVVKVLLVYWLLLLIRFFYDMYFRADVYVFNDKKLQTLLYMIPMTFIPMYSVMKSYKVIDFKKLLTWIYVLFSITIVFSYFSNELFQENVFQRIDANMALNTISTGHLGLSSIILSIYLLLNRKQILFKKLLIIFILILGMIIMLRAGSRGPILSLLAVMSIWILALSNRKILNASILIILSLLVYFFIDYIFQFIEYISPVLEARLNRGQEEQIAGRNSLYIYAWETFLQNPFIGKNFAIYWGDGTMIYSHNFILDSFMQLGILGGLMIIFIIWKTIIKIIDLIKVKSFYFWIGLILVQEIMAIMVSGSFYYSPIVSILIVLLFLPLDRDNYSLQKLQN